MEIKRLILLFFLVLISVTVYAQQPPVDEPGAQVEEHEPEYVAPRFKGGDANNFAKWVTRKLVYPKDAKQKLLEGTVHLSFVVEADGSVSNVTVKKG
ncbi:MAG: energy transducer TonB, partial [Bacteroidales bacterium]|nr:energy transducer TonB [Bacteroidales bacterium]